jgi:tRNA (mo5U34)-methyltransferase
MVAATEPADGAVNILREKVRVLRGEFHSPIDFGHGIVSKPAYVQRRFRRRLRLLRIPDLVGKSVLDIGAWDGYFSFEFERRGAKRVLAIDSWNGRGLECFLLAREHFGSNVEYKRMDVHDLCPEAVGTFDVVFFAGVLYHTRHPLKALEAIRSVTRERLILETHSLIPAAHERVPLITFFPGDADASKFSWHQGAFPTRAWVSAALMAAGFARHDIIYTPSFHLLKKVKALVTNMPQRGRLIAHAFSS